MAARCSIGVVAVGAIDVNWARLAEGARAARAFSPAFFQPNFTAAGATSSQGMQESLTMTVTSTVVGILISIPIGIGAARNLVAAAGLSVLPRHHRGVAHASRKSSSQSCSSRWSASGRSPAFSRCRSRPSAFSRKLLAEDIEDIDPAQAEAIRATGASWLQLVNYAVQPQVMPRLIGLSLYRVDINFRESAVVGIVGAGGIGATLNTALSRYEYDTAAAVLIIIIVIVMFAEYSSGLIRKRIQ